MSKVILLTVALAGLSISGCGTIFQGTTESISVQSTPGAATVRGYTTPAVLELSRKQSHHLVFSKPGYKDAHFDIQTRVSAGYVVFDILVGIIWVAIDASTGGWNDLYPDVAVVTLEKDEASMIPGPDRIDVLVSSHDGRISVQAADTVDVKVVPGD